MQSIVWKWRTLLAVMAATFALAGISLSQGQEDFETVRKRMEQAKPAIQKKHADLLNLRYDLSDRPAKGVTMARGKPVQSGPRAKLNDGMTWQKLAALSPDEIKAKGLFPKGFLPLNVAVNYAVLGLSVLFDGTTWFSHSFAHSSQVFAHPSQAVAEKAL